MHDINYPPLDRTSSKQNKLQFVKYDLLASVRQAAIALLDEPDHEIIKSKS